MQKIVLKIMVVFAFALAAGSAPALAQATRTWVSGVGDDANPCSRTAPCKTFAGAISKTAAGGEINVIDSGGFGAVTITKSLTIRAVGVEAGVLVIGTNGIIVNAATTDRVVLDGLDIEGFSNGTSLNGVNVIQAADVLIKDCNIRGFNNASSAGVVIANSAATARVTIDHSTINNNTNGVNITAAAGFGHLKLFNSLLLNNAADGVKVSGAGNDVIISNNQILGSPKSLEILSGGAVKSYGNNVLPSGDPPTSTLPLQ